MIPAGKKPHGHAFLWLFFFATGAALVLVLSSVIGLIIPANALKSSSGVMLLFFEFPDTCYESLALHPCGDMFCLFREQRCDDPGRVP